jgi:hypothetical protein
MKKIILPLLIFILLFSCKQDKDNAISKGKINQNNQLIILLFRQVGSGKEFPVALLREYGIMIFNIGDETNPIARYELSKQSEKKILVFENYEDLLLALSELPKGSKIDIYDKCTVPIYYGLKDFSEKKLVEYCKQHGLDISKHRNITCTCPE